MSGHVFLALVNPKSGGQVGSSLLARFREILDEDRVHDLSRGGPEGPLLRHKGRDNLRIIGKFSLQILSSYVKLIHTLVCTRIHAVLAKKTKL